MANKQLSQIEVKKTVYDICDTQARKSIAEKEKPQEFILKSTTVDRSSDNGGIVGDILMQDVNEAPVGRLDTGKYPSTHTDYPNGISTRIAVTNPAGSPVNSLAVGITEDGKPFYTMTNPAAFREALGLGTGSTADISKYLPLTGGTLTGNLTISKTYPIINFTGDQSTRLEQKSIRKNAQGTLINNSMGSYYSRDSNNDLIFYSESVITPGGDTYRSYIARRYTEDGSIYYPNGFYLHIRADGKPEVTFPACDSAGVTAAQRTAQQDAQRQA